jgi:hypothetical protein
MDGSEEAPMKTRINFSWIAALTLAMAGLSGCGGHYFCSNGATFGSTCTSSGSGLTTTGGSGGGGGGSAPTAFVYAVDQNATVDGYELNSTAGTFAALSSYTAPTIPATDPGIGMVVAQRQFVYAVFELDNQISGWSLDPTTGGLTPLSGFPLAFTLNSPIFTYNEYNVATNPAGTLLFIADSGGLQVYAFQISAGGALTAVSGSPFSTGLIAPGNLAVDGLGKYLYVSESFGGHIGGQVLAYAIGSGGGLTAVTGSPFSFPTNMWQLQGDPSGNFMVGASGNSVSYSGTDDLHLYVFSIQQTGANAGALSAVTGSPFATFYSPFNIAVQPAGASEFVYSFSVNPSNTGFNPVEGYQLNVSTGALTAVSGSPFSNLAAGYWGQFDQSGDYLLVYGSPLAAGTTATQLSVLSVDSTGVLTQPFSTLDLATPGYWVVTDPQ